MSAPQLYYAAAVGAVDKIKALPNNFNVDILHKVGAEVSRRQCRGGTSLQLLCNEARCCQRFDTCLCFMSVGAILDKQRSLLVLRILARLTLLLLPGCALTHGVLLQSVSALHIASKEGQCKAVVELLRRGANVCLEDDQARSSIAFAHTVIFLYIFLKLCVIMAPVLLCDWHCKLPFTCAECALQHASM